MQKHLATRKNLLSQHAIPDNIGETLLRLRVERHGWTQEELAAEAGVARGTIGRIEAKFGEAQGSVQPSQSGKAAKLFGMAAIAERLPRNDPDQTVQLSA